MSDLDTMLEPLLDDAPPPEPFDAVRARAATVARQRRTKRAVIAAVVVVVCTVSATAVVVKSRRESVVVAPQPVPAPAPAPVHIGEPESFRIGGMDMLDAFGSIWVSRPHQVARLDAMTGRVIATMPVPGESDYRNLAAGAGSIWIDETATSTVTRIDPVTNRVIASIPLRAAPLVVDGLAFVDGKLWIARPEPEDDTKGDIVALDPATNRVVDRATIPRTFGVMPGGTGGTHGLWYMRGTDLVRFDTQTLKTSVVRHDTIAALTASTGRLWLLTEAGVIEVDERTGTQIGTPIPTDPVNVTVEVGDDGVVWIASQPDSSSAGHVAPYDIETHERIALPVPVGVPIQGMIARPNALWVNAGYGLTRIPFTR